MARVEVLVVGREILTGRTLESNANLIAKRVSLAGGRIDQITVVDDEVEAIARSVCDARDRGSALLITTGGLGPTFDDVTLVGIANAIGVPLEIDADALRFIEDAYHDLFRNELIATDGLTPEREKMARLPRGSSWFENPVGTAPGVRSRLDDMEIVSLPGVPRELHAMFDASLFADLQEMFGRSGHAEVTMPTDQTDESVLTRLALELTEKFAGLHIKTNPTYFGDDEGLRVTFSANAKNNDTAREIVNAAMAEMRVRLAEMDEG